MNPPNQRTCTINDMLIWASQNHGKLHSKTKQALAEKVLSQIPWLANIKEMPWKSRNWANRAWLDIQHIGVTESLELAAAKPQQIGCSFKQISAVCKSLQLYTHKINGRIFITRQPLTLATPESRSLAEMSPAERGETSPQLI